MDHDHQMARIRLDHDEQISAMIRKHQDAKTLLEVEVARAKCSTEVVSGFPTGYAMSSTSQSKNLYYSDQPESLVPPGQYSSPSTQTYYSR
jgi:elongation factor P--beta-lysine ligase